MSVADSLAFTPSHDEASRHNFVGALKGFVNQGLEARLAGLFDRDLAPLHAAAHGRAPATRAEAAALLEPHPLYQLWATLTFHSQNLMWSTVQQTTMRTVDTQNAVIDRLISNPAKLGSLTIDPTIPVPPPISTHEIHRQPGGYTREAHSGDNSTALTYIGTVGLYRNAKGMNAGGAAPSSDEMGQFISRVVTKHAPDLAPAAILDMGCGAGQQTLAYKRNFPQAEVTGIDCSRPFVRYAHALAESEGEAIHYANMDACAVGYPDETFDLIVSYILFHETSAEQARAVLKESWRLLRPGGLVLHADVPYHPARMPLVKQVTNNWQVANNGEPFWTGFVQMEMQEELARAGFAMGAAICDYESSGPATYFFFGGRKPA